LLNGRPLWIREAVGSSLLVGTHGDGREVERASSGIFQQTVGDAVCLVARPEDARLEQLQIARCDERFSQVGGVGKVQLDVLDKLGHKTRPVESGCACDDPVEVVGIALRLHQGLTAAARASFEI